MYSNVRFVMLQFDGSVLPIFEKQILNGGPLTVTDKDVSRYFMSIRSAISIKYNCYR